MAGQQRATSNPALSAAALVHCACWILAALAAQAQEATPEQTQEPAQERAQEPAPEPTLEALDAADPLTPQSPGEPAEPTADVPVTRFEVSDEMRRLADSGDYAAAAALSDRLVTLSEQEFGPGSTDVADAYVQAADIQSRSGDYAAAEESGLRAVEIYRNAEGPFSASLIGPFLVLGDNYQRRDDHLSAVSSFNEARTVSRRVYGLLNEGQIDIIDRMTESFLDLNQFEEALAMQVEALTLVERSHEPHSPEVLSAVYKYARWLRSNNRFTDEREQYFRLDRIIREHYGENSIQMVRVLRERANSFRTQGAEDPLGINGLRDALAILESQPEPDPLSLAEVLRDIGDWEAAFSRMGVDGEAYRRSWRLLGEVQNGETIRRQWFDDTVIVFIAELSRRGLSYDTNDPEGHVLVHFTVDTSGRTTDVVIVESEPPGLKDEAVARQIRASRFRPGIVDGELAERRRALDIRFRYLGDE